MDEPNAGPWIPALYRPSPNPRAEGVPHVARVDRTKPRRFTSRCQVEISASKLPVQFPISKADVRNRPHAEPIPLVLRDFCAEMRLLLRVTRQRGFQQSFNVESLLLVVLEA